MHVMPDDTIGDATRETEVQAALGPDPHAVLDCLADLGLTDDEIARYFRLCPDRIARLRRRSGGRPVV